MQRSTNSSGDSGRKLRINIKPPPSKLREVATPDEPIPSRRVPARSSTQNKRPIIDADTDEDEDDDEELSEEEDGGGNAGLGSSESSQEEGDYDSEEVSQVRRAQLQKVQRNPPKYHDPYAGRRGNSRVQSSKPGRKPSPSRALGITKSVEDQEMADAASSDELSDPEDMDDDEQPLETPVRDEEDDDEDEEEDDEEDAEGEAEDEDEEMDMDDERNDTIRVASLADEDLDSDGSMDSSTPDPSKLTRRQRGEAESALLALSNEAQKKKFFTDEQITMRRAEMARRRKDLSEKRNEEEKADTLKRLLEKQPPKRRSKAQMMADAEREEFGGTPVAEGEVVRPSRAFVRTVVAREGSKIGVPEEWEGTEVDRYFSGMAKAPALKVTKAFRMVQEVE